MKDTAVYRNALGQLRQALARLKSSNGEFETMVQARDEVFARFQPLFSLQNVDHLAKDEFRSFLLLENNKHWTGLHRQGPRICSDMKKLRLSLQQILDETQALPDRLNDAVQKVSGMGKAIVTAILLVAYPDRYGVWNNTSEGALKALELWPQFERGTSFGERYIKVNEILLNLAQDLEIDLWTLDVLWWFLPPTGEPPGPERKPGPEQRFGLERHLQEFLRDNWNRTTLGQEWNIYGEPGDDEAGYEYPCDIGRIDILAKHKTQRKWLVIELKRDQTSDATVGQVLRYIGWVQDKLAAVGEEVKGLIIAHEADEGLHYAIRATPNVQLILYQVEFHLKKPDRKRKSGKTDI